MDTVREALKGMLDRYVGLVNCGDCGNWDPETEPEVIAARAALASQEAQSTGEPKACPVCYAMPPCQHSHPLAAGWPVPPSDDISTALRQYEATKAAPAQPPHDMSREAGAPEDIPWRKLHTAPKGVPVLVQFHVWNDPVKPIAQQVAWFWNGEWRPYPNTEDTAYADLWKPIPLAPPQPADKP